MSNSEEILSNNTDLQRILKTVNELPVAVEYTAGDNIKIENNVISVLTADEASEDNTRPITSAAVNSIVGNIEVLLETI